MLLFISYLFGNIATINKINGSYIYFYAAFVFAGVYAYTELMDRNPYAIFWEMIKNIFGLTIIYKTGDWFGASQFIPWINYVLIAYFITSTLVAGWFVYLHRKEDRSFSAVPAN